MANINSFAHADGGASRRYIAPRSLVLVLVVSGAVLVGACQGSVQVTISTVTPTTTRPPIFAIASRIAASLTPPTATLTTSIKSDTVTPNPPPSLTPSLIPSDTPLPTATIPPTTRSATATLRPTARRATATSTRGIVQSPTLRSAFPADVYVTQLRLEPPQPLRREAITFYATFLNTTDAARAYNWRVRIFDADSNREFYKTGLRSISVPVGKTEIAMGDDFVVRGAGGCVSFYAQAFSQNPDESLVPFKSTDGKVITTSFTVCPPP